jgi:Spy/CpxP family protein refolding chaperone
MITTMKCMNWKNIFRSSALLTLALVMAHAVFAQGKPRGPGREKLESARIALITERLDLDPETAQKFWPIYNQIKEEERTLRREEMQMRRTLDPGRLNDTEAKAQLDNYFQLKENLLALEKQAAKSYQEVLMPKQVLQLFKAEADFRSMLLEKMGERRRRGGPR